MEKVISRIACLLLVVFLATPACAQLLMEKSRVEETVKPGDTIVDTITLHNNGKQPMDLTIYWEDFEYLPPFDGKKKFMPAGSGSYSMANWIAFSPKEVTILPHNKKDINFAIKVPSSATGGHYGVMFFESGSRQRADTTGVSIVTRMGALFFIESTVKDKTAQIKNMDFSGNQLQGVFVNKGNIILFPQGIYYIMDKEGLVTKRGELNKIYLPPGNEAPFAIDLSHDLKEGEYTLVLTFDLAQGDSVVKEIDLKKNSDATYQILQQRD